MSSYLLCMIDRYIGMVTFSLCLTAALIAGLYEVHVTELRAYRGLQLSCDFYHVMSDIVKILYTVLAL